MSADQRVGLDAAWGDVQTFHRAFGQPAPERPQRQATEQVERRQAWIIEEVNELGDAETLVDQADAYIDIIYFALGGLVELGVRPGPLFDIVQAANMAKLGPDGRPMFREDGKILKPEGWEPPEPKLAAEIERQLAGDAAAGEEGPVWGWWAGRSEEYFGYGGPFKTREEAIECGRENADGEGFCICEAVEHRLRFNARNLIDAQYFEQDDLFDFDNCDPDRRGPKPVIDAADAELQASLDGWLSRWGHTFIKPNLFAASRSTEWIAGDAEAEGEATEAAIPGAAE